ncbi:MAG: hypothetical protein ACI9R3_003600 [Verrucomicrobiales bacterium]
MQAFVALSNRGCFSVERHFACWREPIELIVGRLVQVAHSPGSNGAQRRDSLFDSWSILESSWKMSIKHHPLATEFPEHRETIHILKQENAHFHKFMVKYEEVDKEIVRMEDGIETPEDAVLTQLKKERLELKDELLLMLNKN